MCIGLHERRGRDNETEKKDGGKAFHVGISKVGMVILIQHVMTEENSRRAKQ